MANFLTRNLLVCAIIIALGPGSYVRAETINLEVAASTVDRDKFSNDVVITIELSPEAKTAFENFTQRHKGRNIEIRLGTTMLLRARLVEEIKGGTIRATTKFNLDEGQKVSAQLVRGSLITLEDVDG